jgi:hypothetical protein
METCAPQADPRFLTIGNSWLVVAICGQKMWRKSALVPPCWGCAELGCLDGQGERPGDAADGQVAVHEELPVQVGAGQYGDSGGLMSSSPHGYEPVVQPKGCMMLMLPSGCSCQVGERNERRYEMAEIRHRFGIAAPKERVYRALTTTAGLSSWWSTTGGNPQVGGKLRFFFGLAEPAATMEIVDLKPTRRPLASGHRLGHRRADARRPGPGRPGDGDHVTRGPALQGRVPL